MQVQVDVSIVGMLTQRIYFVGYIIRIKYQPQIKPLITRQCSRVINYRFPGTPFKNNF